MFCWGGLNTSTGIAPTSLRVPVVCPGPKAPMHLGFSETIRKVYPAGTRVIWTHRDPATSIPSLCSLFQTMIEMHQVCGTR